MSVSRFCPRCGRPVDPTAAFCGACGTPMPPPGAPPAYTWVAVPVVQGPYSSENGPLPQALLSANDARAMERVTRASIFGMVAVIASFVVPYAFGFSVLSFHVDRTTFPNVNAIYGLMATALATLVVSCFEFWYFRETFRALAPQDKGMDTPARMAILAIPGIAISVGSALWILAQAYHWFQCGSGFSSIPASCIGIGQLLAAAALLLVGAIVYFVGLVGIWIGLWRLGSRYDESMFQIGMILTIFPLVDIVGFILIILAARKVRDRLTARGFTIGS